MKKRFVITIMMISMLLLSGCGEMTLEEKVAKVQKANIITVQDVIDLMELEGLQVEKVTPSNEFQTRWSEGELVKVNNTLYMAMKSFDENLWERRNAASDMGWSAGFGVDPNDEKNVLSYIGREYMGYDTWVYGSELCGKNIIALLLPIYPDNISELSRDEQYAALETINADTDILKRVFYNDINGMITQEVSAESENFKINGTLYYYATGVVDENAERKWTYYDARTWLDGEIVCSDAVWNQYQGTEYEVSVEKPDGWVNGGGRSIDRSVLEYADKRLNMPNMNTKDVMWKAPESAPVYVLTVKIGDIEETFRLEPASE